MVKVIPLYPYPILMIEDSNKEKYIVITDIHIGLEEKIMKKGIFIDSKEIVDEIIDILLDTVAREKIENLIILGDLKSSINIITRSEWDNVPYFLNELSKIFNIYIIPGNHDGNITHLITNNNIRLMSIKGMEFENILLTHGHAIPKIGKNIEKIITGHLHPILIKEGSIINGQRVWIRIILKKSQNKVGKEEDKDNQNKRNELIDKKLEFIIIPHFNKYLSHSSSISLENKLSKRNPNARLPLLNDLINKKGWEMNQVFVISLNGSIIGSENELKKIL
jgi:metallophosphoesterase superfamily enzyme